MSRRGSWRTQFGFYLVAIGSACGLGNLWRFPYVVGENGGGAFVLLYLLMAFVLGAPLLIAELMLGKKTRQSVMSATISLESKDSIPWRWAGRASILMSIVVLSYYAVIAGWVLHFIVQFALGLFAAQESVSAGISVLSGNGWLQWALASVHLLLSLLVVAKGVQEGLEKWITSVMPFFALLVGVLVIRAMSLPSSPDVLRFLFYPDFSKLTWSSLNHAIGQVLFTLSVGFGTMVTFGSYFRDSDHAPTAGFRVTLVDALVSLFIGLLIFPIAFLASEVLVTDPTLLFEMLPKFLLSLPGGVYFGLIFFVSLYLAALNASVGLFETIVANTMEFKIRRDKASWIVGGVVFCLSLLPALSSSLLKNFRWGGKSVIENMDMILVNWFLPVVALVVSVAILRGVGEKGLRELFIQSNNPTSAAMWSHWLFAMKHLVPTLILLGLILQIMGVFQTA